MEEMEVLEYDFHEFTSHEFVPPSRFFIKNAMGNYVFPKTISRKKAQEYVDLTYGKGKYTVCSMYQLPSKGKETAK